MMAVLDIGVDALEDHDVTLRHNRRQQHGNLIDVQIREAKALFNQGEGTGCTL